MSRTVGTAAGSALALALLVCWCVFAALAGPALSLHTRTQALHQTLAGYPNTTKTVQVTASWETFSGSLQPIRPGQNLDNVLPQALNDVGYGLRATPLPLAAGEWASLTAKPIRVAAGAAARAQAGAPPQLEVSYRTSLTGFAQLVAGTFSGSRVPSGDVGVTATTQTAARFGMHPGSRLTLAAPSGPVTLFVTAIVRERDAGATFWQQDTNLLRPALQQTTPVSPLFWAGGVIADPDQFGAFQTAFGGTGLALQLEFPLTIGGVNADQVQGLYNALNHATAVTPTLTGALAPAAETLTVSSPILQDLALFLGTQAAVETVLLLLFVSLVVVGVAVILLTGRMLVARREGELAILRARGGSLWQVAGLTLRGAVVAAGPGVLIGAGLAVAVVPGGGASAGWPLAAIAILAALAGPPVIAVWQHRKPAPPANPALITTAETRSTGPARRWRRPVAEVTAIAASVAGLVVLHDHGVPAGGSGSGIDLYLAIVPILVAVPVVVIMLRLYPLIIRGLLAL
ncbi:MAG TPA: FtsX-like permease family protein, partial [Streptosporangiaceae bacterium]|nr:FtsX-like permease family protein [Streptosporangiaceae bacterium]